MVLLQNISDALSAAAAAFGSALFISFSLLNRRKRRRSCSFTEKEEEAGQEAGRRRRRVLVLGLDGAGKSSLLRGLAPGESSAEKSRPTRGFNFVSVDTSVCQLDFLEIGGSEELRRHWSEYVKRSHVLVFVVDSSDPRRLPLAKAELHRLLGAEPQLPVVVLANKQDKPSAVPVSVLDHLLLVKSRSDMFLMAAHMDSHEDLKKNKKKNSCWSLDDVLELLLLLV